MISLCKILKFYFNLEASLLDPMFFKLDLYKSVVDIHHLFFSKFFDKIYYFSEIFKLFF